MKTIVAGLVLLITVSTIRADDEFFPWPKKFSGSDEKATAIVLDDNVVVHSLASKKTTIALLTLEAPKTPSHQYRLVGQVKYEKVEGDGYLEMLNVFPDQGTFFSRTLLPEGPMAKISGSSDWREFQLPFYSKPGVLPSKLIVSLILPGQGKVWITPLKMEVAEPMQEANAGEEAFSWPLIAALLSGIVGVLGTFVALFAGNPALRRPALILTMLLVPCSLAALLAGVIVWARETGQNLWSPVGLIVGLWLAVFLATNYLLKRKLASQEFRRMQALDASAR